MRRGASWHGQRGRGRKQLWSWWEEITGTVRQRPLPALGSAGEGLTRPGFSEKPGSQGAGTECLSFSYKDYKK